MEIRRAVLSDAEAIGALWYQLSRYHEAFYEYYAVREDSQVDLIAHVQDLLKRECICYVAEEEMRVVGFVTGYIVRRNPHLRIEKVGKVDNIFVLPEFRGKKVGTQLLDALCAYCTAQGAQYIELSCDIQNPDALRLYKRLGFVEQKVLLIRSNH